MKKWDKNKLGLSCAKLRLSTLLDFTIKLAAAEKKLTGWVGGGGWSVDQT